MPREPWSRLAKSAEAPCSATSGGRNGFDIERRHATQLAAMFAVVERSPAMHRGTVVPDHQIAHSPLVAIDELRLGCMLDQIAQQQPSLGHRPVDDARRMRGEVKRLASSTRVGM